MRSQDPLRGTLGAMLLAAGFLAMAATPAQAARFGTGCTAPEQTPL